MSSSSIQLKMRLNPLLILVTFLVTACAVEPVSQSETFPEDTFETSTALRITLERISESAEEKTALTKSRLNELCFQFVYPVSLGYNTGETIVVENYDRLLEVILSETLERHIISIAYPFRIVKRDSGQEVLITDEAGFMQVVQDCGYEAITYTDVITEAGSCFEVIYPLTLLVNTNPVDFGSAIEAQEYFAAQYAAIQSLGIAYPLNVRLTATDEELTIADDYELIYLFKETCGFQ
ncbi:hypothetical protein [Leeuwenhoekiella sp. H156]|uniref:hypothetical protein n=1 Tax=Leeuwenhoekiella sp. H156 TaxID=3450128 RepID=UPI003FA424E9